MSDKFVRITGNDCQGEHYHLLAQHEMREGEPMVFFYGDGELDPDGKLRSWDACFSTTPEVLVQGLAELGFGISYVVPQEQPAPTDPSTPPT